MFCQKCGNQVQDGEKFCPVCGAAMEDSAQAPAQTPAADAAAVAAVSPVDKIVKFIKSNIVLLGGALVVLIAAIVIIASIVSGRSAEGIAKKAIKAAASGDLQKADSYSLITTEDTFRKNAKDADMDLDEYLEEKHKCSSMKEYWKDAEEQYEKDYLDGDYKVKIDKVKDVDVYTNKELKEFKENHEEDFDKYDLDIDKVKSVARVTVKIRVSDGDDSEKMDRSITLVKYKGSWKVLG